jgi:hypothetical protein
MTDLENLTLEHLRAIRAKIDSMEHKIDDLAAEQRMANAHVSGLVQHENYALRKFAEMEVRLERMEKRLDLRED